MFDAAPGRFGPLKAPPGRVEVRVFTDGLAVSRHRRSEEFYIAWSICYGFLLLFVGSLLWDSSRSWAGKAMAIAGGVVLGLVVLYFLLRYLFLAGVAVFALFSVTTKRGRASAKREFRKSGKRWNAVTASSLRGYIEADGDRVWTCPTSEVRQVSQVTSAGTGSEFTIVTAFGEMPLRARFGRQRRLRRLHTRLTELTTARLHGGQSRS